ncbi:MAG: winged helix-turn-helix transcriptional regulator [Chloroflexi bacterium]|nr:winged helix-turn-helix transcriptional regulator [Chloroflexota bacterium]
MGQDPETTTEHVCDRYQAAFEILGKRWNGLILRALADGPRRFTEIARFVPDLSDRVLSQRLVELEELLIVERAVDVSHRPVLVEYSLTPRGRALSPVLDSVHAWADKWIRKSSRAPAK